MVIVDTLYVIISMVVVDASTNRLRSFFTITQSVHIADGYVISMVVVDTLYVIISMVIVDTSTNRLRSFFTITQSVHIADGYVISMVVVDTLYVISMVVVHTSYVIISIVIVDTSTNRLRSFFTITQSVHIAADCSDDIEISFLPFSPGVYQCALILSDDSVGELLYLINGTAHLPLPEKLPMLDNSSGKMYYIQLLCRL